jgi:hypothetical protein
VAKPYGMLVEGYNYAGVAEADFHDWYDNEHLPAVAGVKGVLSANRWMNAEELSSMPGLGGNASNKVAVAIYDLESPEVVQSADYRAIAHGNKSARGRDMHAKCQTVCYFESEQTLPGSQVSPPESRGVMLFAMNVLPEVDAEFNSWFDDEHIPNLSKVPGVLAARRFRMPVGGSHRYLILYHLSKPEVQATDAWKKGGASPWTDKMKPHFLPKERNPLRLVLRHYARKS